MLASARLQIPLEATEDLTTNLIYAQERPAYVYERTYT